MAQHNNMAQHIEQLQTAVALAAQDAALLEVQARAAGELANAARVRLECLRADLASALAARGLEVLRAGWQEQDAQGGINARPAP